MTFDELDTALDVLEDNMDAFDATVDLVMSQAITRICNTCPLYYTTVVPVSFLETTCASPAGDLLGGTTNWNELSDMDACLLPFNEGKFLGVDDDVDEFIYIFAPDLNHGYIGLDGATFDDAEGITTYLDGDVSKVIVGSFGDNAGTRSIKSFFRFNEPEDCTGPQILPSDEWEQVDWVFPETPLFDNGGTKGDVETIFVADGKIWVFTKRELVSKIYSLPLQESYIGTQILDYEGEVYPVENPVGATTPGNIVGGSITSDGLHVILKTYNAIYTWTRSSTLTPLPLLLSLPPTQLAYPGLGPHPDQEPKGEAICFSQDDQQIYMTSESGTGSSAASGGFPIFVSDRGDLDLTQAITYQDEAILDPYHCPILHPV